MVESPYLTHEEAAAYLKVAPSNFKRNYAAKIQKTYISTKEIRFKTEHLDEYVNSIQGVAQECRARIQRGAKGTFKTKSTAA